MVEKLDLGTQATKYKWKLMARWNLFSLETIRIPIYDILRYSEGNLFLKMYIMDTKTLNVWLGNLIYKSSNLMLATYRKTQLIIRNKLLQIPLIIHKLWAKYQLRNKLMDARTV